MAEFLFVPTIVFLAVVAPIWIIMHYRSVRGSSRGLSPEDLESFEQMLETLDQMNDRIETLESILEADHPKWRKHSYSRTDINRETK